MTREAPLRQHSTSPVFAAPAWAPSVIPQRQSPEGQLAPSPAGRAWAGPLQAGGEWGGAWPVLGRSLNTSVRLPVSPPPVPPLPLHALCSPGASTEGGGRPSGRGAVTPCPPQRPGHGIIYGSAG